MTQDARMLVRLAADDPAIAAAAGDLVDLDGAGPALAELVAALPPSGALLLQVAAWADRLGVVAVVLHQP